MLYRDLPCNTYVDSIHGAPKEHDKNLKHYILMIWYDDSNWHIVANTVIYAPLRCPTSPNNDWRYVAGVSLLGSSVAFAFVGVTGTQRRLRRNNLSHEFGRLNSQTVDMNCIRFSTWRCWICNKCWIIKGSESQFVALRPPWLYTKLCGQHRTICQRKGRSGRTCGKRKILEGFAIFLRYPPWN